MTLEILNDYVWKDANHIDLKTLWKYLTNYLYLPRLKNEQVLLDAIADGVGRDLFSWEENFAYASGFDKATEKYLGLTAGSPIIPNFSSSDFLVKPDVASAQFKVEQEERQRSESTSNANSGNNKAGQTSTDTIDSVSASTNGASSKTDSLTVTTIEPQPKRRFHGTVELSSLRLIDDVQKIADEVVQHLTSLNKGIVKVTLEIEAQEKDGIPDDVIRTVSENCKTLKFKSQGFEDE